MSIVEKITEAFYNPQTGLTRNIAKLKEKNPDLWGIPHKTIRGILDQQIANYQKNEKVASIHAKERVKYHASYIGQLIHADLMFIKSPRNTTQEILVKDEDGEDNRYILILVDTYSRYIWAYPLKTKSAPRVTELIRDTVSFIREFFYNGYRGLRFTIYTDAGTEFSTKNIEKQVNVKHKIARGHAALAESAIYRLRTKIKYLDGGEGKRKLDNDTFIELIQNLNLDSDADAIFEKEKLPKEPEFKTPTDPPVYKQGDYVRVVRNKELFEKKSGSSNFSDHIFVIASSIWIPFDGVYVYKLVTPDGELLSGKNWLAKQLKKVPLTFIANEGLNQEYTKVDMKTFFLS